MSNEKSIDPGLAMRVAQKQQAHNMAKVWTDAMKTEGMSAIMVGFDMPIDDPNAMMVGRVDEALRELGYEIASHSHSIFGEQEQEIAGVVRRVKVCNISLLIRVIGGGSAKRIIG